MNLEEAGAWLGLVVGSVVVIAAVIGALVFVRGSWSRAQIEKMKSDIETYEKREELHAKEMRDVQEQLAQCVAKLEAKETENLILREAATQRAAVEELRTEVTALLDALLKAVDRLGNLLEAQK